MHILYIYQYFTTPKGSSDTRSYEFAQRWVAKGHKITLTTGNYDLGGLELGEGFVQKQTIEGINLVIVGTKYSSEQSFYRRIISFLGFTLFSIYVGLKTRGVDVIYATSTPLTVGIPALVLKWLKHIPFVFEVRDQWPETPIEMGIIRNKVLIKLLLWLERLIYKNSAAIFAVSAGMAEDIRQVAGETKPVYVVPNGADLDIFRPDINGRAVRQKKRWDDKLVLIHAGAMGKTNGLDFIIDVAEKLRDYPDVLFVLIGEGNKKEYLKSRAEELGLVNVEILSSVPRHQLPAVLAAADVVMAIIGKFPIIERHASLNKFYDGLSSGKPILLNYSGWQKKLLEKNKAGFGCELCNIEQFVERVLYIRSHREELDEMGQNARQIAQEKFNRTKLARHVLDVLCNVVKANH